MARLRKIGKGGHYFALFYDRERQPKEKSYPLRTTRQDVARLRLGKLEKKYDKGKFDPWAPEPFGALPEHVTVQEGIQRFLQSRSHLRPRTIQTYRELLLDATKSLAPGLLLRDVRVDHLQRWIDEANLSTATRRKRYAHLRAFLKWAHSERLLSTSNLLGGLRQPKREQKAAAFLTPEDLERLLVALDYHAAHAADASGRTPDVQWLRDMILVAVGTGLRRGELLALRWSDVHLDGAFGFITVANRHGFKTKGGNERRIPLVGDARSVIERLALEREDKMEGPVFTDRRGLPIKPIRVTKVFKKMVRLAKLDERLHFHSLRHTCGSWLAMKGVPLRVIQEILGHASITTTEIYSHLSPETLSKAMQQVFGSNPS